MSISVAQMGARMHYAVPRILNEAGVLDRLFTDLCASKGWPRLLKRVPRALRPGRLEKILTRVPKGVSTQRITAFTYFGIEYARRLSVARTGEERDAVFLWAGREFSRKILQKGLGNTTVIYGFNTASIELFQGAGTGVRKILEQTICPREIEEELLDQEKERHPSWDRADRSVLAKELAERERAEWDVADLILCASEYVRDGVVASGGEAGKCRVVPYGVERPSSVSLQKERKPGPLRVLTAGAVGLRKGSPYVMEAARQLKGSVEFRMVGAHHASASAISSLQKIVNAPGSIPRSEMAENYRWADVYLLPSLCEGSATSTYEAMFHRLPVICTPNTGSVMRDGIEGFEVPLRDSDAIVEALRRFISAPDLLESMSEAAIERASQFSLDQYARNLRAALDLAPISSSSLS